MKTVQLKPNYISPVTLEEKPYINRTFYPNIKYNVSTEMYNKHREHYFDLIPAPFISPIIETKQIEEEIVEEMLFDDGKDIKVEIKSQKQQVSKRKNKRGK